MCGRRCEGDRCLEHARRGSHRSAEYQRNAPVARASALSCWRCGGPFTVEDPVTAGHVIPLAEGGTDDLANLRAEHESCNKRAGRLQQEMAPAWRPYDAPVATPRLLV